MYIYIPYIYTYYIYIPYIYIYIYIYINSIYIWKRPEQRGQRGRHKLVRACAIPDALTSEQPRDVDLGAYAATLVQSERASIASDSPGVR